MSLPWKLAPVLLLATPLLAQPGSPWADNEAYLKGAIADCRAAGRDRTVCRHFTGQALQKLFGIGDFCKPNRCLKAVEIEWELRNNPDKWTFLGTATDQAALDKARDLAVQGKAVMAVQVSQDRGQIALVMPEPSVPSRQWKAQVPLAVAARVDRPEKSLYGKGINWIFDQPEQVKLYARK